MKLYFAKYLPVEGEIKPPCIVLETLTTGEKQLFQVDTKNDIDIKNQQLVKLFLCSRDVQVGDKVYEILSDKSIGDEFEWTSEIAKYNDSEPCFKVIGEISTDATWVKEGDEFDEEKLRYIYTPEIKPSMCEVDAIPEREIVYIKGPCGHFH